MHGLKFAVYERGAIVRKGKVEDAWRLTCVFRNKNDAIQCAADLYPEPEDHLEYVKVRQFAN